MPSKRIAAREGFFLGTYRAAHFLLADVVYGVFVPREVVRSGKYRTARLACRGIYPVASVRPGLRIALHELRRTHSRSYTGRDARGAPMSVALVPLEFLRRLEALRATVVRATESPSVGVRVGFRCHC